METFVLNANGKPISLQGSKIDGFANSMDYEPGTEFTVYVGVAGNVKIDAASGGTETFVGIRAGTVLPVLAKKVYASGTTANSLVAILNA